MTRTGYPHVVNRHVLELMWGGVALIGGGLLVTNVRGVADRFQAMSYAYRSWPRTCPVDQVRSQMVRAAAVAVPR